MSFYNELSKVYDIVFPFDKTTAAFLEKDLQKNSNVLDLGCGTGSYSIELAKVGHNVTGIDLDETMIEDAKIKKGNSSSEFYTEDMLQFKNVVKDKAFDMIFCIGNSLVHLKDKQSVNKMLQEIYSSLKSNGYTIVQIINYDRIIEKNITSLPTINREPEGVKFVRNYNVHEDNSIVDFNTQLIINKKGEEKIYENSVPLLVLKSEELVQMFKEVGFSEVELFGDFDGEKYNKDSYALVIKASV